MMKKFIVLALLFSSQLIGANPIVFQPQFTWADGSCTEQGTGSFVQTPDGKTIGMTSAHFLNFTGPQLLEAKWLDIRTGKCCATASKSLGKPGTAGTGMDFSSDYILLVMEGNIPPKSLLELDPRPQAQAGERIWFPNKDRNAKEGYKRIEGTLIAVHDTYIEAKLDKPINLNTRSGTPVISQTTNKVIGLLTGGGMKDNYTLIYLPLKDVVGRK
jgi:hypothetical protein